MTHNDLTWRGRPKRGPEDDDLSDVELLVANFFAWLLCRWRCRRDFPMARARNK